MTGAAATLGGDLALGLPERTLDGKLTLALPRLAVLAPALGQDLAGALEIEPSFRAAASRRRTPLGPGAGPGPADRRPADREPGAEDRRDQICARRRRASSRSRLNASGLEARLATGYRLQASQLHLTGLQLTGPRSRIGGELSVDLGRTTALAGELSGEAGDLAAIAPLLPLRLRGQAKLDARARAGEPAPVGGARPLDGSELQQRLRPACAEPPPRAPPSPTRWVAPRIDGRLGVDGYRQGQIALERARVTAGARSPRSR